MKPFQANLVNALVLVACGLWDAWQHSESSSTALIPVGFGLLFALSTPPLRKENRLVLYLLAILTFLLLIALLMSLLRAIRTGPALEILRQGLMLTGSGYAFFVFVRKEMATLRSSGET